jgi:EAL domain-containing protein (putative c-di-GMP-specific phosphodiesterase class I)
MLPRVAINIAGAQLRQSGFPDEVQKLLQTHSVDAGLIELELAERSLLEDPVGMQERLFALKDIGVRLAIDRFGAGTSSLSQLQRFPLDVLKLDRSLVSGVDSNIETQIICGIALTIAHRLSLDAVADGVESESQETFLTRQDCLYGQGVFFSAPVGPDQVAAVMAERGIQTQRKTRRVIRRRKASTVA